MKIKQYIGIVVVMLVLAAVVILPKQLTPGSESQPSQQSYRALCTVSQGCQVDTDLGGVRLAIQPAEMTPMEPLAIELNLEGFSADRVKMEFIGRDMPMGMPSFYLTREGSSGDIDVFRGEGSITFCTTDENMVWMARLVIETKSEITTVVFELES